jgi:DNA-binding transcriptional MerR regulator
MEYTSRQVAELYKVSVETIRQWTQEFGDFLSLSTRPGANKSRRYSVEDMRVLALVADMKHMGMGSDDILATLLSGQRGADPDEIEQGAQLAIQSDREKRLSFEVSRLSGLFEQTKKQLEEAQAKLAEMQQVRDENVKLQTSLEHEAQQRQALEQQVKELHTRAQELAERVGREYSKGFIEGLREKGELPKRDER